jgi:excisionase family DNA binding protein
MLHYVILSDPQYEEGGEHMPGVKKSLGPTLTVEEVADLLHMRPDSLTRKIRLGEIPAFRVGRRWLIEPETLEALVKPSVQDRSGKN